MLNGIYKNRNLNFVYLNDITGIHAANIPHITKTTSHLIPLTTSCVGCLPTNSSPPVKIITTYVYTTQNKTAKKACINADVFAFFHESIFIVFILPAPLKGPLA